MPKETTALDTALMLARAAGSGIAKIVWGRWGGWRQARRGTWA